MSSNFFQKVMMTAVIVLMTWAAVNVTVAQETGTAPTQNVFLADPNGDALNARKEEPYLHPKDCDKFYGKLPRLYLHGNWKLMVVPNTGKKPGRADYFLDDRGMVEGFTRADYDDRKWDDFYIPQKIILTKDNKYGIKFTKIPPVPSVNEYGSPVASAGKQLPYSIADGYSYLSTRFFVPSGMAGQRLILRLEAADSLPIVFLNGKEVARFATVALAANGDIYAADLTDYLIPGQSNRLVVRTYNQFYQDNWDVKTASFNCNGIWGSTWIEFWPEARVETMKITPQFPDSIQTSLKWVNAGKKQDAKIKVLVEPWRGAHSLAVDTAGKPWEHTFNCPLNAGGSKTSFTMPLPGIKSWHMDTPFLYSVKIFVNDSLAGWDTFGMRSLSREAGKLRMNGKPFYLFGATFEESQLSDNNGDRSTLSRNKNGFLARLMAYYKQDMGMNAAIRGGYMPEIFYQLCDELGLARTDEALILLPSYLDPNILALFQNPFYLAYHRSGSRTPIIEAEPRFRKYYQRIVELNYNHPSIIGWGTPTEQYIGGRTNYDLLADILGSLDPTRLKFEQGGIFCNTKWSADGKSHFEKWGENDSPAGPAGFDFMGIHNRPMQYGYGLSLGAEIDELKLYEYKSRLAYKEAGGIPIIAAPSLHMEAFQDQWYYLPWRPEDIARIPANRPDRLETIAAVRKLLTAEGSYDKKQFCDYILTVQPKLRGYLFSPFSIRLIGLADYALATPRKYQFIAFENQRLGELFRLHSDLFRGFASGHNIDILPAPATMEARPFTALLDTDYLKPYYMSKYMKRMQQPVLPVLDWHMKHNLFSGEKAKYTLTVLNDSTGEIGAGKVTSRILPGSAFEIFDLGAAPAEVYEKSFDVAAIPCGGRWQQDISLDVPGSLAPGRYTLELVYTGKDGLAADNRYPINIGGRSQERITSTRRTALYGGPPNGPNLGNILSGLGVAFDPVKDFARLGEYKVLILSPYSIDEVVKTHGEKINAWLSAGGTLLCFEQNIKGPFPFLPQATLKLAEERPVHFSTRVVRGPDAPATESGFHVVEPIEKHHPIFQGINDIKDFDTWNGKKGRVYSSLIQPLSEGVLLFGGFGGGPTENALDKLGGRDHFEYGMAAAEVREDKGVCLFSQVEAVMRYDTDPVARRYVNQLIAYALSPDAGKYAKPLRIKSISQKKEKPTKKTENIKPLIHLSFDNIPRDEVKNEGTIAAQIKLVDGNSVIDNQGKDGKALRFDGKTAFQINNASFDFNKGFTIEFQMKPQDMSFGFILCFEQLFFLRLENNAIKTGNRLYSEKHALTVTEKIDINETAWTHVVISFDPEKDSATRIFINGKESAYARQDEVKKGKAPVCAKSIFIGKRQETKAGDGRLYNGSLDEFKIYDRGIMQ